MHLQIRSTLPASGGSNGPGAMNIRETSPGVTLATPGRLVRLLELLAEDRSNDPSDRHGGFNLVAAAGSGIETTGTFIFAVAAASHDAEEEEYRCALARILGEFPDSRIVERQHGDLHHREGALRDYIRTFSDQGLLIDEIVVGVADCRSDEHDKDHGAEIECRVPVQVSVIDARADR